MKRRSDVQDFFDAARNHGATDESIVGLLRGREWPQEDVYRALADDFEQRSGVAVPAYKRSASAKDAFLYLLSFSTLATWATGLSSVLFALIDRWIKDPVAPVSYSGSYYQMADSIARMVVAFPIYLVTMRYITRELEVHSEKIESSVRKWLTYLALFVTATVVVCDLIVFLTFLLRGEVTSRFIAKVITTLAIAGGIFWYYIGSLAAQPGLKEAGEPE